jgi:hypothetical protein
MKRLVFVIALLTGVVAPLYSQASTSAALTGIRNVMVEFGDSQFDTASLRTAVELRLRRTGLHVVSGGSDEKIDAMLTIQFQYEIDPSAYVGVFALLKVERRVYLHPSPGAPAVIANVWQRSYVTTSRSDALQAATEQATDRFLNQWLESNPR